MRVPRLSNFRISFTVLWIVIVLGQCEGESTQGESNGAEKAIIESISGPIKAIPKSRQRKSLYTVQKVPKGLNADIYKQFADPGAFRDGLKDGTAAFSAFANEGPKSSPVNKNSPAFQNSAGKDYKSGSNEYSEEGLGSNNDYFSSKIPASPGKESSRAYHSTEMGPADATFGHQSTGGVGLGSSPFQNTGPFAPPAHRQGHGSGASYPHEDRIPGPGGDRAPPHAHERPVYGGGYPMPAYDSNFPQLSIKEILGGPMNWIDLASDRSGDGEGEGQPGSRQEMSVEDTWGGPQRAESSAERYRSSGGDKWRHSPNTDTRQHSLHSRAGSPPPSGHGQSDFGYESVPSGGYNNPPPPPWVPNYPPHPYKEDRAGPALGQGPPRTEHMNIGPIPYGSAEGDARFEGPSRHLEGGMEPDIDMDEWKKGFMVPDKPGHKHYVQYMGYGPHGAPPQMSPWGHRASPVPPMASGPDPFGPPMSRGYQDGPPQLTPNYPPWSSGAPQAYHQNEPSFQANYPAQFNNAFRNGPVQSYGPPTTPFYEPYGPPIPSDVPPYGPPNAYHGPPNDFYGPPKESYGSHGHQGSPPYPSEYSPKAHESSWEGPKAPAKSAEGWKEEAVYSPKFSGPGKSIPKWDSREHSKKKSDRGKKYDEFETSRWEKSAEKSAEKEWKSTSKEKAHQKLEAGNGPPHNEHAPKYGHSAFSEGFFDKNFEEYPQTGPHDYYHPKPQHNSGPQAVGNPREFPNSQFGSPYPDAPTKHKSHSAPPYDYGPPQGPEINSYEHQAPGPEHGYPAPNIPKGYPKRNKTNGWKKRKEANKDSKQAIY